MPFVFLCAGRAFAFAGGRLRAGGAGGFFRGVQKMERLRAAFARRGRCFAVAGRKTFMPAASAWRGDCLFDEVRQRMTDAVSVRHGCQMLFPRGAEAVSVTLPVTSLSRLFPRSTDTAQIVQIQ